MSTARDQIKGALRLIGQLAEGEEPSPATAQDSLVALNQMLDSWSTERLAVFGTQDQVFTWPPGAISRTLGPGVGNDFIGNYPVKLDDSTYFRDPATNVSYGLKFINQLQYNGIAVKTVTSTYPQLMFTNMNEDHIHMFVYPVPLRALEFHFVSVIPLTQAADLSTVLVLPAGYLRAFKYNLALELSAEFGVEASQTVKRIAMTSKRNLKRINATEEFMSMPYGLMVTRQRYNIFAGNF
jgi:hypothetical protein